VAMGGMSLHVRSRDHSAAGRVGLGEPGVPAARYYGEPWNIAIRA
jgi:hypothetical protein